MITGAAAERMLTLTGIPPFEVFKESELLLIAEHMHTRSYGEGDTIFAAGQLAEVMVVTTSGHAVRRHGVEQQQLPAILGASSVLFSAPIEKEVFASANGVEALCLAKPHLFTIARECPDFIVGLTALSSGAKP